MNVLQLYNIELEWVHLEIKKRAKIKYFKSIYAKERKNTSNEVYLNCKSFLVDQMRRKNNTVFDCF